MTRKKETIITISVRASFRAKNAPKGIEAMLKLLEKRACAFKLRRLK